ncbi:hypothetical protein JTE90_000399 [Oedothorax gibbosus]|uniref:Calcitonin receptor n=1 Tax=Oedothorax gibbosus TaxID=931172 RepID=A0AAV6URI8_9ARAC|nr:hypothetical protein JTE90_000399 [Oedothorax gibbosus]
MNIKHLWICCFGFTLIVQVWSAAPFDVKTHTNASSEATLCRVSGGKLLSPEMFAYYSCAKCYRHMDATLFANGTKFIERGGFWLQDPITKQAYLATYENTSSPIFGSFQNKKQTMLWINCCKAAVSCCDVMRATLPVPPDRDMCPRTWDGWNCWPDTAAGTVQEAPCPAYIYFNSELPQCTRYATKTCWENSTWYRNSGGNEFSDYSTCGQGEDIKLLLNIHMGTFGISIVLLLPALGIFFYYRQLRVHRIFMHKNLFISLLLTAVFVTVYESYFIGNFINNPDSILESNQAGCKVFYTLTKYLRLCTYSWMFCEGFYLHKLIAAAFAEQKSILPYHIIGWGVPAVPVGIWAITRHQVADELCWTVPYGHIEWIIYVPMVLALVVNFGFLAHIIQVIVTKLRSTHADEPAQFRRAVRATMVLIPLFGLHFLLLSFHPHKDCHGLLIYNIATYSLDGLQGGIVSLLFCYFNNEVLFLLRRTYERKRMLRDIHSHMSSRKKSRTSVSTNVDSMEQEGLRKK